MPNRISDSMISGEFLSSRDIVKPSSILKVVEFRT